MLRLSVLLLAIFISCQQKEMGTAEKAAEPDSILIGATDLADTTQEIGTTDVALAVSTPRAKIQILFSGTFHADEVKDNVEDLPWLGLFADDHGNFVLTETKIIAQRVVDGL